MNKTEKRERLLNAMIHHNRVVYHPQEICNMITDYMIPEYYTVMPLHNEQCNYEFLIELESTYRNSFIRRRILKNSYKKYTLKDLENIAWNISDKGDYGICPPCIPAQKMIDEVNRYFLGGFSNWLYGMNIMLPENISERNIMIYEYLKITYKNSLIRRTYKGY